MIENIIFDIENVIVSNVDDKLLELIYGKYYKFIRINIFRSKIWKELDLGNISKKDALKQFLNKYPSKKDIIISVMNNWYKLLKINMDVFYLIKDLSKRYNLYIISNIHEDAYNYLNNFLNFDKYFKEIILSYKVHIMKPNKKIFNLLKIDKEKSLFIDDKDINIKNSGFLGRCVKPNDFEDLKKILNEYNIIYKKD